MSVRISCAKHIQYSNSGIRIAVHLTIKIDKKKNHQNSCKNTVFYTVKEKRRRKSCQKWTTNCYFHMFLLVSFWDKAYREIDGIKMRHEFIRCFTSAFLVYDFFSRHRLENKMARQAYTMNVSLVSWTEPMLSRQALCFPL